MAFHVTWAALDSSLLGPLGHDGLPSKPLASSPFELDIGISGGTPDRNVALGPLELSATTSELGSGTRVNLELHYPARGRSSPPIRPGRLVLRTEARARRVLERGWQSWSVIGPRRPTDIHKERRLMPGWFRATYNVDPLMAGRAVCGDQFLLMEHVVSGRDLSQVGGEVHPGALIGFLDGKRHLSTILADPAGVSVVAYLDGIALSPGDSWHLDPLWIATGDPGALYAEFAGHWGDISGARRDGANHLGWCSWYHYFSRIKPDSLRSNLELAADHGLDCVQIDDGYQLAIGDWTEPNATFGPDLSSHARVIQEHHVQAGLWTAPFLAVKGSRVFHSHPDWFVRGKHGRPKMALWNPIGWSGRAFTLDTTRQDVLAHLRSTFAALVEQGWDYHKIDFCYAAATPGARQGDGNLTRAQALRMGLEAVREGIGDGSYLLGCGCPFAQASGIVDAMRVSPDTGPYWSTGPVRVPGYSATLPSTLDALNASLLHAPLHRRLWLNDPDCLLLRPARSRLNAAQRSVASAVVAGTGGFTILSDNLALYGPREWNRVEELRDLQKLCDTPLLLHDPFATTLEVSGEHGHHLRVRLRPGEPTSGGLTSSDPPDGVAAIEGGNRLRGVWARLCLPDDILPAGSQTCEA